MGYPQLWKYASPAEDLIPVRAGRRLLP